MRVAVPAEERLQVHESGGVAWADEDQTGAVTRDQRHPAQDEGAHDGLTDLGRPDHQGPQMYGIEGDRLTTLRTRSTLGDGGPTGQLTHFTGHLARPMAHDGALVTETVAAGHSNGAGHHEISGRVFGTECEEELARREPTDFAARKASCPLPIGFREGWEHLVVAIGNACHGRTSAGMVGGGSSLSDNPG